MSRRTGLSMWIRRGLVWPLVAALDFPRIPIDATDGTLASCNEAGWCDNAAATSCKPQNLVGSCL